MLVGDKIMSKLTIRAHTKSKARLIGGRKGTNYFIVGQEYEVYFVVKNIGNETSTSGKCFIEIEWPGTKAGTTMDFPVKPLEPNKCEVSKKWTLIAHSNALALISLNKILPPIHNGKHGHPAYAKLFDLNLIDENGRSKLNFVRESDEKKLETNVIFHTFYATTPEAIYGYWAFIVAATSLSIIAIKELWPVVKFLISFLC